MTITKYFSSLLKYWYHSAGTSL